MGNCISKINKDHFFAFEEEMKNFVLFYKENTWFGLDMLTGGTYMRLYSIKKYSKMLASSQTGAWWGDLFQNGLGV